MKETILSSIRAAAKKKILFLQHAVSQMNRPERMISPSEVRGVIRTGEVIEYYADDPRGESCLLLGKGDGNRPIHVVCAPKKDFLAIITAYLPDSKIWLYDFKERRPL
jgi:hypothetical protein